jgi:periplasmic protein TonB
MEVKKSPKADLEKQKMLFTQIGLVVALGLMFVAFEWAQTDVKASDIFVMQEEVLEEEAIPVTRQEEIKPPPPPPPPRFTEVLNIVENDVELEEELEIEDMEIDEDTEVDFIDIGSDEDEEIDETEVFMIVETMPSFPGGEAALTRFLNENIKYPTIAQENGISGRVFINFVVNRDGQIVDSKVVRGVDPALDQEAMRVVKMMPKWNPGQQRGKPVRVSFMLPVNFVLN